MYKLLLILKYLRRKLAPLFAALAVMLCTAMVIIVISVMGGWLNMMRASIKRMTGDVIIRSSFTGFPEYKTILERLQKLPNVEAATPLIEAYGLLKMPDEEVVRVEVVGIEPQGMEAVTGYRKTLYWSSQDYLAAKLSVMPPMSELTPQAQARVQAIKDLWQKTDMRDYAMQFKPLPEHAKDNLPGIVVGVAVPPGSRRDENGKFDIFNSSLGEQVTLTVLPLTPKGDITSIEPAYARFSVCNEFKSGLYEIDASRVYVPLELLQKKLKMDPYFKVDPETGEETKKMVSGRVTEIMVRGKPGVDSQALREEVAQDMRAFLATQPSFPLIRVATSEDERRTFLDAVEKEKGMLVVLFAFISIVAVAMIAVIFYMIVLEKTRDIGVLRAIGGSRNGIMSIFLGYGLAIGAIGAGLGLGLAALIVRNLNEIQDFLFRVFGFKMWDPSIYYFDRIPNQLDPREVTVIVIVAVVASVLGAVVPAYLAGRLNPVEALRYE